jgi:hypothetical protein
VSLTPSPQFYTPDDVKAILLADFSTRQIAAVVEVGEWDPEIGRGAPRVLVGYGKGKVGEPGGHYQPGAMWSPPGTSGEVARAMLDDAQRVTFLVHAPAASSAEGNAAAARRATDQLFRATLAALSRAIGGPFREPAEVSWPGKDDERFKDYEAFVFGSIVEFDLVLASPILDDPFLVINVTEATATMQIEYPDGTLTTPEAA